MTRGAPVPQRAAAAGTGAGALGESRAMEA